MAEKTLTKTTSRGRKPSTAKTTAKKEVEKIEEEVQEVKETKKEKKEFGQEDGILCRSVTEGLLIVTGPKSDMGYRFPEYGTEMEIEYRDLVAIVRSKFNLIKYPFFVILDDDFVQEFPQVKKFYEDNYPVFDLRDILQKPIPEMVSIIKKLPQGAVESLKNIISTDIQSGNINEIDRVKALNEIYDMDFNMVNAVFSEGD